MATLFRRTRMPAASRRCDVDVLCAEDGIEVLESRVPDPGYTACLFPDPLGTGGAIFLASGQDNGRRRFSISHELAHYHIPTHRRAREQGLSCGERELHANATAADIEGEANDFASELLMPAREFRLDLNVRDVSIATALQLASDDFYDVSVTAAAWRMVQVAKDPCALVVTSNGTIEWVVRSQALRVPGLRRGSIIPGDTLAWSGTQGGESQTHPLEVDVEAWFQPQFPVRATLMESTHVIRSRAQVISLLWLVESDDQDLTSLPD